MPCAARGIKVTEIIDHGCAQSIYFKDPNGLKLEYACMTRNLTEDDAVMQDRRTITHANLDLEIGPGAELSRVAPVLVACHAPKPPAAPRAVVTSLCSERTRA